MLLIDVCVKSWVKVIFNDGWEVGLLLFCGLLLCGGDVFSNEEGIEFVQVIVVDEGVLVVCCDDFFMLVKVCYYFGNCYVLLQIMLGELCYYYDYVLDDMLCQFGLMVIFGQLLFELEVGVYVSESYGYYYVYYDYYVYSYQYVDSGIMFVVDVVGQQ